MQLLTLFLTLAQIPEIAGTPTDFVRMRFTEIEAGSGVAAKPGQEFTVHYTGWLTNGKKFDSSRDRNQPLKFIQGRRRVIAGWEAGFEGMKIGGKRRLFIPYQMAYGEQGRGAIPPKAELIFDVELLGAEDVKPAVAAIDLMNPFEDTASKLLALAKAIPEDKLDWRPAPGVRSFREVILHTAYGNKALLWMATDTPPQDLVDQRFKDYARKESESLTKDKTVELLAENLEAVRKILPTLRPAVLDREMPVFGQPSTMRGIYVIIDTHMAEHLGQLIAYARTNGITPPWSQKQQ